MVELFENQAQFFDKHSSKGNQLKWERDGIWYKADYTGYEGLSEFVISQLLKKSTLKRDEYVIYDLEQIKYKRQLFNGVKSRNFLKSGWQIVTLQRLYHSYYNRNFTEDIWKIPDVLERVKFVVNQVEDLTQLKDFGIYLSKLLTIDALFLNEDRHMHNIAIIMDGDGKMDFCPFFDQGAGLMSDTTMDYPLGVEPLEMLSEVKAKTICTSFEEALDAVEQLYGYHIKFHFSKKDVQNLLEPQLSYPPEVKKRVETIIYEQMRKYPYLFDSY